VNKIRLLFFFLFLSATVFAQSKSYKRGAAYGQHSAADMAKASENISWWYNWAGQPVSAIRNYLHINGENTVASHKILVK
jgi:hypothetical protein